MMIFIRQQLTHIHSDIVFSFLLNYRDFKPSALIVIKFAS